MGRAADDDAGNTLQPCRSLIILDCPGSTQPSLAPTWPIKTLRKPVVVALCVYHLLPQAAPSDYMYRIGALVGMQTITAQLNFILDNRDRVSDDLQQRLGGKTILICNPAPGERALLCFDQVVC